MMIAALVALAFGASAGIFLASRHFLRKRMPAMVALLHGLGGATGFTLVLLTVVREPTFQPIREVLYLLIATVVLGVVNLLFHIRKVRHRTSLIVLHGLTAVTSALMLIRAIVVHTEPSAAAATAPSATVAVPGPASAAPQVAAPDAATADAGERAPAASPGEKAEEFVVDDATRRVLEQPIHFETKSAAIRQDSLARIAEIASLLEARPDITLVEVQGHADERGEDAANVALTRARAESVVSALVAKGVARERLHSAGYGARCPADPDCRRSDAPESCHDPANWQRDRRVVFLVLQVGKVPYRGEVACERAVDLIPAEDRRFHSVGGAP